MNILKEITEVFNVAAEVVGSVVNGAKNTALFGAALVGGLGFAIYNNSQTRYPSRKTSQKRKNIDTEPNTPQSSME